MDPACVGHLATALGVERRLGELHGHAPVREASAGANDAEDLEALVAHERDGQLGMGALEVVELAWAGVEGASLLGGTGALTLFLHEMLEALFVNAHAPLRGDLACKVEGEAVGVVQLEGHLGRKLGARVAPRPQSFVEDAHALLQGAPEALLFVLDHAARSCRATPRAAGRPHP